MANTFIVEVDWTKSSWVDETSYVRRVQIRSGFDRNDQPVAALGTCRIVLENTTQRFSPEYAAGALYGELLPRREVRIQATDGVDTWTLFRGFIERIVPDAGELGERECVLECVDGLAILERQRVGVTHEDSKDVDQAVSAIVALGYTTPSTSYSDNGDSLTHYGRSWLPEKTTVAAALREICEAVYGRFYIGRDGTATYLSRDDRLDSSGDAGIHIGDAAAYWQRLRDVQSGNLIGLWRLNEASGTDVLDSSGNGYHGTYTGATLQALAGPDLVNCIECDGVNDYAVVNDAGWRSAFNGAAGTIFIWGKVSAGTWTDGVKRDLIQIPNDGSNYILVRKHNSANVLHWYYMAGGTIEIGSKSGVSTSDWFSVALTWDKAADEVKAYFNGVQEGTTKTGLGTWSGLPDEVSFSDSSYDWDGGLALAAIWDEALSPAKILQIGTV